MIYDTVAAVADELLCTSNISPFKLLYAFYPLAVYYSKTPRGDIRAARGSGSNVMTFAF